MRFLLSESVLSQRRSDIRRIHTPFCAAYVCPTLAGSVGLPQPSTPLVRRPVPLSPRVFGLFLPMRRVRPWQGDTKQVGLKLDVHFISSLPVILRSACKAWVDREPVQIVAAED